MANQQLIDELKGLEKEECIKRLMAYSYLKSLGSAEIGDILTDLGYKFRPYGSYLSSTLALIRAAVLCQDELYNAIFPNVFGMAGIAQGLPPVSSVQVAQLFLSDYCPIAEQFIKDKGMWIGE